MTPREYGWAGLLLSLVFVLASCADFRDPPVVTIGPETWTLTDLRRAYAELDSKWRMPLGAREAREDFVRRLIERRLLAEYGDSLLAADGVSDATWAAAADEILLKRLRVVVGSGESPSDAEVSEAMRRMAVRSRIERLQFPDEASALAARARIVAGESFADVAAEGLGALLEEQWLGWRPPSDELSDRVAALEVGEVSEVFRAGFVDQLVRVVERVPTGAPAGSETDALRGLQAQRAGERWKELVHALRTAAVVEIDESAVGELSAATERTILAGSVAQHEGRWAIPELDESQGAATVARWHGGSVTGGDYVEALRLATPAHRPWGGFLARQVRAAAEAEVDRRLLLGEAGRRGLRTDPWVERALRKVREDHEIRRALEQIEEGVPVSGAEMDSVQQLLQSLPVPILRKEERALVLRYDFPTRTAATAELARIRAAGGGWSRLREILRGDHAFAGTVQLLSLSGQGVAEPVIAAALLDPLGADLTGPFDMTGRWVVMHRLKLDPARAMTEDEIREEIDRRIRQDRSEAANGDWIVQRRRARSVTVDEDLLDALSPGG